MAVNANATKLANLVNPQVMADMINQKLTDDIKLLPLFRVDATLQGRPGDTLTLPSFAYIGDAEVVAEGQDIPIKKLETATKEVKVHKVGNGVELTDEAVLSGYGDPMGEAIKQLRHSIANAIDNNGLEILEAIGEDMTETVTKTDGKAFADGIADALVKFGEDIEGEKVLLVSPADYALLRKANDWIPSTEAGANAVINGYVGMIHGAQVVVVNKLATSGNAYIVKPGALALYLKRDLLLETDRDIIAKSTVITVDKHFVLYLYDESKAIKLA